MKLVCFPHYTCGGLLCDILNHTRHGIASNGGISSPHHNLGKMGDSDTVLTEYNVDQFMSKISKISSPGWTGTHNWPGLLPLDQFDQVINVTTVTHRSQIYRWLRAYQFYYLESKPWLEQHGQARIDKERETAKNYLVPFEPVAHRNVINLEFSEVVEHQPSFANLIRDHKAAGNNIQGWQQQNDFLYSLPPWTKVASTRFHEAEFEVKLNTYYEYQ